MLILAELKEKLEELKSTGNSANIDEIERITNAIEIMKYEDCCDIDKIVLTNIKWNTDDEALPKEMTFEISLDNVYLLKGTDNYWRGNIDYPPALSDYLEDKYGHRTEKYSLSIVGCDYYCDYYCKQRAACNE